jgi:ATP adenylyltransferase/5',5'''-P-1,P-4-tetraphosphate phosphorylase II
VLSDRILSTFPSTPTGSLPQLCETLLHQQQSSWPQLFDGYASLKEVRVREVTCEGYSIFVQFNPKRKVSTGANVDSKSIKDRRCFLCAENLPPEEKGVLYRDEFLVLCNPWPILESHLTIAHIKHIPQAIEGLLLTFLELAQAMSPGFTVFYNGPKCGASAPDHRHFQAGPIGRIPIEREAMDAARRELKMSRSGAFLYLLKNLGRQVIVIESSDVSRMEALLSRLFLSMRQVLRTDEEPMVNLLGSCQEGMWRVIVFPRSKHRPNAFYKDGEAKVLISPAATDVGGILVTPFERDFNRVDAEIIQDIFDEVMLDKSTVERIVAAV